jgi:hypothetical protein
MGTRQMNIAKAYRRMVAQLVRDLAPIKRDAILAFVATHLHDETITIDDLNEVAAAAHERWEMA